MASLRLPRVLSLSSVFGEKYATWSCHVSMPTVVGPSSSVFLTRVHSDGRMSPVQVPTDYASAPRFGLAAFHSGDNVQAFRVFREPLESTAAGGWEVWLSALTVVDRSRNVTEGPNCFCQDGDAFYLAAHAAPPAGNGGPVVPLHVFILPSVLVGPDELLFSSSSSSKQFAHKKRNWIKQT